MKQSLNKSNQCEFAEELGTICPGQDEQIQAGILSDRNWRI